MVSSRANAQTAQTMRRKEEVEGVFITLESSTKGAGMARTKTMDKVHEYLHCRIQTELCQAMGEDFAKLSHAGKFGNGCSRALHLPSWI